MNETISAEIDRIMPLGLTREEAKMWYRRDVLMPALRRGSTLLVVGSLLVLSMFTLIGERLEANLITLMVMQPLILIIAGFLYAYGVAIMLFITSRFSAKTAAIRIAFEKFNALFNKAGFLTFAISAFSLAYWYLPENFDAAVLTNSLRLEMQFTLLIVGMLVFIGSRQLARRIRLIAPVVAGKAMGMYGMFLVLTPFNIYSAYSVSQQIEAGVVLLTLMLALDFTLVPAWLYNYFGRSTAEYVNPYGWAQCD